MFTLDCMGGSLGRQHKVVMEGHEKRSWMLIDLNQVLRFEAKDVLQRVKN